MLDISNFKTMNIGIVTWVSYYNLGTSLQAYALQRVIRKMGYKDALVDDRLIIKSYLKKVNKPWKIKLMPLVNAFRSCISSQQRRLSKQNRLFRSFTRKYLDIFSWSKYDELEQAFDMFVTGSDQIWSPIASPLTQEYQTDYSHYFLRFTTKKKISYAPSIKLKDGDEKMDLLLRKWLESYSHISVRERYGATSLRRITKRDIKVVLDPTLLLTGDEWNEAISSSKSTTENYISCYFIRYNGSYIARVKELASELNLKIRLMTPRTEYNDKDCEIIAAGPEEFLYEVKNCSYFLSDSFHGTVFALLFNKPFLTFENEEIGSVNERITNILKTVGEQQLLLTASKCTLLDIYSRIKRIDYGPINEKIATERDKCLIWLKNAIDE